MQVVAFQLLPELATGSGVHVCTGDGPVLTIGQVVEIQFGAVPGLATQEPLATFSELLVAQLLVV